MGSKWPELGFLSTLMAPKSLLLTLNGPVSGCSVATPDTGSLAPDFKALLHSVLCLPPLQNPGLEGRVSLV